MNDVHVILTARPRGRGIKSTVIVLLQATVGNLWYLTFGRKAAKRWMDQAVADVLTRPRPSSDLHEVLAHAHALAARELAAELSADHVLRALNGESPDLHAPVPGSIQFAPSLCDALDAARAIARKEGRTEMTRADIEQVLRPS